MYCLACLAFNIVSAVVNVLLTIMKSVDSTLIPSIALSKSIGSTFARNFNLIPYDDTRPFVENLRASYTNSGPR